MRSAAIALALACGLLAAQPLFAAPGTYNAVDRVELNRVSAYLNSIRTMKGGFVQIDPNGDVDQGTFAISKPGRMRFEYRPPTPTLIVSDGRTVAVANSQLRTLDSYPLNQTPLDLILGDKIDLAGSHEIVGVARQQDAFIVKARSRGGRTQGNITLTFSEPELELRQWTVIDNQGLSTTVALRDVQTGIDIPASLFVLPNKTALRPKQSD
jgi:outer membrane lipoprotein-sorting protein